MKLFSLGLENEDVNTKTENEQMTVEDLLDSLEVAEIESTLAEVEAMEFSLETGEEALASMESLIKVQEEMIENGEEITETDLKLMKISLESILDTLGYDNKEVFTASLESASDPKEAVVASLEEEKSIIGRAWEAIKKFFNKMLQMLIDITNRIVMMVSNLRKSYAAIQGKAAEIKDDASAKDFEKETKEKLAKYFLAASEKLNFSKLDDAAIDAIEKFYTDLTNGLVKVIEKETKDTEIKTTIQNIARESDEDRLANMIKEKLSDEDITKEVSISFYADMLRVLKTKEVDMKSKLGEDFVKKLGKEVIKRPAVEVVKVEKDPSSLDVAPASLKRIKSDSKLMDMIKTIDSISKTGKNVSEKAKKYMKEVESVKKQEIPSDSKTGKIANKLLELVVKFTGEDVAISLKTLSYMQLDGFKTGSAILKYYNESLKQYS